MLLGYLFASFLIVAFYGTGVQAEPYWLFLEKDPQWVAGDTVSPDYLEHIRAAGLQIRTISRYFNAVTIEWNGEYPPQLDIPGVIEIRPVNALVRSDRTSNSLDTATGDATSPVYGAYKPADGTNNHLYEYGYSFTQLNLLNIPTLHDIGLTGNGVVIGVLDAGFTLEGTACLRNVNVTHTRNFITGGEDVAGHSHGSQVLACVAGLDPGRYYGVAFNASYLLALTENAYSETPAEEDRWVAAVEWCDSLGADIISSSLVYNIYDPPYSSYTPEDMNGHTSLVAQAAEIAWERGMIVVNAAGNEGANSWGIVATPADAEHVLSVGAIRLPASGYEPTVLPTSSRGPTADGRIKPDVVAPGEWVLVPQLGTTFYGYTSGTSYATPLVSGLCALLLEANPDMTNQEVVDVIRDTARDMGSDGPDNEYGWGIPDAFAAYSGSTVLVADEHDFFAKNDRNLFPESIVLSQPFPNPFNASVSIPVDIVTASPVTVEVFDITGRRVSRLWQGDMGRGRHTLTWHGDDNSSGTYIVRIVAGDATRSRKVVFTK